MDKILDSLILAFDDLSRDKEHITWGELYIGIYDGDIVIDCGWGCGELWVKQDNEYYPDNTFNDPMGTIEQQR